MIELKVSQCLSVGLAVFHGIPEKQYSLDRGIPIRLSVSSVPRDKSFRSVFHFKLKESCFDFPLSYITLFLIFFL